MDSVMLQVVVLLCAFPAGVAIGYVCHAASARMLGQRRQGKGRWRR